MATVTKTIGTSQDYSTVAAWEADLDDTGIYNSGDDAVGEVADEDLETESVTINGGGTVGLNSITLTSQSGARGDGTAAGRKATLFVNTTATNCIDDINTTVPVTIKNLTFYASITGFAASGGMITIASTPEVIIENCLIYSTDDSANDRGLIVKSTAGAAEVTVRNCVFYNWKTELLHDARSSTGSGYGEYYNNTFYDGTSDGFEKSGDGSNDTIKNCSCTDTTSGSDIDIGSPAMTHDYNQSEDSSVSGEANGDTGVTAANEYVSTSPVDLHLKTGATAIGAGIGPSSDANVPTYDLEGNTRSGTSCDRGAFEFQAAAAGSSQAVIIA